MTVRLCSHRRDFLPMQSDVLNESQQHSNNDNESSTNSFPTHTATTLIYSGLKLHPKPLVPTISMPGVASPLSIVKKLPIPESHLDNSIRNSTSSAIRLVTPTGKSSPPTSTSNGTFSTSKAFILNSPSTNSTNSTPLLTLIPPGTTSPKIQTLNSVTISTNNEFNTNSNSNPTDLSIKTSNPPVFLTKNRVTLITNPPSTSSSTTTNSTSTIPPKLVIQQNPTSTTSNATFWPQQNSTKIFSIPPTAKVISRPVQLIPTTLSSNEHSTTHITHVQTVKTDKHENLYPLNVHFGLSTTPTNETPLNLHHGHSLTTKNLDQTAFIHMQLLPATNPNESSPVQLTLPTTHLYSTTSSIFLSNNSQRSPMDINNNHQSSPTITTPIIREMNIEEKLSERSTTKNRTRLPLQPSAQQVSLTSSIPSSSNSIPTTSNIRQPKKHKLIDAEQTSSNEPPTKVSIYEQFDSTVKSSRPRPLAKFSIENATPSSSSSSNETTTSTTSFAKKRSSAETANAAILSRKRRLISKVNPNGISNENLDEETTNQRRNSINGNEIDDELLKRLSQDFVYVDQRTGIRWIGRKARPKSLTSLVSRFSWKPKINHYEKYSDIIRTNPKRTVPIENFDQMKKKLTQPWASWRIDRLKTSLADLTRDEQITENQLSDTISSLNLVDPNLRSNIDDLIQANLQRHRSFSDQLKQISAVIGQILDHGNHLRDFCSISKTKRTKER